MEQVKLNDVLHLYIGCKYMLKNDTSGEIFDLKAAYLSEEPYGFKNVIVPILRPLSDMADEEYLKVNELVGIWSKGDLPHVSHDLKIAQGKLIIALGEIKHQLDFSLPMAHKLTAYLLSCNLDLFNLIQSGEAIDATTLTVNPYKK